GFGLYVQALPYATVTGNVLDNTLRAGPMDNSLPWAALTLAQADGGAVAGNSIRYTGTEVAELYPGQAVFAAAASQAAPALALANTNDAELTHNGVLWSNGAGIQLEGSGAGITLSENQITHAANDAI